MNNQGIIYKVTNLINNKIYIGQTISKLSKRKTSHIWAAVNKKDNFYFHNAINKYGKESFEWKIIWSGNKQLLNNKEINYITIYNSFNNGYNMDKGGQDNCCYNKIFGSANPAYNPILYTFYHIDGYIESNITKYQFINKYKLDRSNLDKLFRNESKSYKNWFINPLHIKKYNFIHKNGDIIKNITQNEMNKRFNFSKSYLSNLINGKITIAKGWKLLKSPS